MASIFATTTAGTSCNGSSTIRSPLDGSGHRGGAARFIILNTKFLVFDTQSLVFSTKFLVFNTKSMIFLTARSIWLSAAGCISSGSTQKRNVDSTQSKPGEFVSARRYLELQN